MIDAVAARQHFPALAPRPTGPQPLYFDNPAGTQVPQEMIEGVVRYLECCNSNTGGSFTTSRATDGVIEEARAGMVDFLNASSPSEIVFGQNMTSLTFHLSHGLRRLLQPGDEIVTTRLEHDANVSPWLALQADGIVVRFVDIHPEDMTLDLESAEEVIGDRTRLVAVGYASNAFGTVNDVRRIVDMAHAHNAWVFVDAVHYGPHGPIDVRALNCDLLACSSYKFFGPHLGILWGRYPVLESIPADHVRPAGTIPPDTWETGTQSHEALAGLLGTLGYLRSLGDGDLHHALREIRAYERSLSERLIGGLRAIPGITVYGVTDPAAFDRRVPTAAWRMKGRDPFEMAEALGSREIYSWAGDHYAVEPVRQLGTDAVQRVGLVHYNTPAEIDRFLENVEDVARS